MKNDLISRTEAVEEVSKALKGTFVEYEDIAEKIINKVPSAKLSPCDACKYAPPSSMDGKPCAVCPAEGR